MNALELDPSLLRTFLAVVDAKQVSGAARALHLSQPAVTAQLKRLEEALRTALFVRSVRGVTPTEAGSRLVVHARAVQRQIEAAVAEVAGNSKEQLAPLVLAASTTVAAHPLPPLLAHFRNQFRNVSIRLDIRNTESVIEEVRAGRIGLGLVEGHSRAPGIRLEPFIDDEIVPIVGHGSPYRVRRTSDLDKVPILWREQGSGTRAVVARSLKQAGLARRTAQSLDLDMGSTEALVSAAAAGLGVAFVSRWSARASLDAGLVQVLPGLDLVIRRTFRWALPAGGVVGVAAQFYEMANQVKPRV